MSSTDKSEKHTALPTETPWYAHPTTDIEYMDITNEEEGNGSSIAHVFGPLHPGDKSEGQSWKTMQANAELIVAAVNSYPARAKLLEAAKEALAWIGQGKPINKGAKCDTQEEAIAQLREAIREAEA